MISMKDKIIIGMVSYNPDVKKLIRYIDNLIDNFNIVIVDNCSNNFELLKNEIGNKIKLIPQDKNYGIAHALALAVSNFFNI